MPSRLTEADRKLIAQARELAAIDTIAGLRERYSTAPGASNEYVFADMWGESSHLLTQLAIRLLTLGGL
jgi:hypothetical protein